MNDSGPQKNVRTPMSASDGIRFIAGPRNGSIRISVSSTPNPCIQAASRRSASCRSRVVASERCPTARKPMECPVSASSRAYRSRE